MRLLFIDHYDSFSFNLIDWLYTACGAVEVERLAFDAPNVLSRWEAEPRPLIFSPGPNAPRDIPQSLELLQKAAYRVPIVGICLGHQLLAHAFGAQIIRAKAPYHGTTIQVKPISKDLIFGNLPTEELKVATYNSLVVDRSSLSNEFLVTAIDDLDQVQGIQSKDVSRPPMIGWQFHPESFLTTCGVALGGALRDALIHNPTN